jgi:hypothetical protein
MIGPDKLECYITISWKGLPVTNRLPYQDHVKVTNNVNTTQGPWSACYFHTI